jgi:hypothetical protein
MGALAPSEAWADQIPASPASELDLDPQILEESPVLQQWLRAVPDVQQQIRQTPAFRTRVRWGYIRWATSNQDGWSVALEDLRLSPTRLVLNGDYQRTFAGGHSTWGANVGYYVRPLGSRLNLAPTVGVQQIDLGTTSTTGSRLGIRLLLALSRGGAADMVITQNWVFPGDRAEIGLTTLTLGYALTTNLRLSTDFQRQNSRQGSENRFGAGLELLF